MATGFVAAIIFLTRVPIPTRRPPAPLPRAVVWFPVVGALVGALVGGIAVGLGELTTPTVAAAVAVTAGMLVTGAFHEDGLADLADAVAGGATRERRLEILKDPRHGTYGVAALCASIVVRVAALGALVADGPRAALLGAIAAHALGRGVAVAAMAIPAAGPSGLGADYTRAVGTVRSLAGLVLGVLALGVAAGRWTPVVAAAALVAAGAVVRVAHRAVGGVTGDVLGALEQVAEATTLVALSAR